MSILDIKSGRSGASRFLQLVMRHFDAFYRHNTPRKFFNICSLHIQKWSNRTLLTSYPAEIILDVTNICNLQCPLCPTGQRKNKRPLGKMDFALYKKIIDELSPWLYKIRLYNWGEPLLHEDIHRMTAYASKKNIGTEISSNLNCLSDHDAASLVESGLDLLIVSLDGADQETYSRYRIGGDFNKVLDNISAIVREKRKRGSKYPLIEIQFLAMGHNEEQIASMGELTKKLGADRFWVGPVTVNILNQADRVWLPKDEKKSRYSYNNGRDKIYITRKKCEWLWRSAVINWDGTVSPCCVFESPEAEVGSLEAKGFAEVWNNENYRKAREVFVRKGHPGKSVICQRCKGVPKVFDKDQHGLY